MNEVIEMLKSVNWETITIFGVSLTALIPVFIVLVKSFATKLFNKLSPNAKETIKKLDTLKIELSCLKDEIANILKEEVIEIKGQLKNVLENEIKLEEELNTIITSNKVLDKRQKSKEIAKQNAIEEEKAKVLMQESKEQEQEVKVIPEETQVLSKPTQETTKKKKAKNSKKTNVSYM